MSRIAYVNGLYQRHAGAVVHIEDRGFQFADGVYEVWSVFDGRLADYEGHMTRLQRSLGELQIRMPMTPQALTVVLKETIRRNRVDDGIVYLQITRGAARRDHPFPAADTPPSVIVTSRRVDQARAGAQAKRGVAIVTRPDLRWGRCDIKTVGLLPNVLAKQAAREVGAYECWLVDELGLVTEGTSTNAWIIDADGVLRTRDTQANILRGCTRSTLIQIIRDEGIPFEERAFTVDEAKSAREAFFTAAGAFVMPAISIDGTKVGTGRPGPITRRLREAYLDAARDSAV